MVDRVEMLDLWQIKEKRWKNDTLCVPKSDGPWSLLWYCALRLMLNPMLRVANSEITLITTLVLLRTLCTSTDAKYISWGWLVLNVKKIVCIKKGLCVREGKGVKYMWKNIYRSAPKRRINCWKCMPASRSKCMSENRAKHVH